jgi:glycosyltransferase involved in cell wall biosynthesis
LNWPKISIVTPSFNQGKYIEQTILSVINQNYPNLEYIVIDGGSTDATVDIIRKYEQHITYWVSEPDRGQSHAINKGIQKCTGDIFNWLNSDDWYMPNALFDIASSFIKDPSLNVVSGFENHINLDGKVVLHEGTVIQNSLEETIELCHITQPSTFFKLDALRMVGFISEDLDYLMDGEMWVRFLLMHGHSNFQKINIPLVNFRLHQNSKTVKHLHNKFLVERNSIVIDLQRFIGVPDKIRDFWLNHVYNSDVIIELNRNWNINSKYTTDRILRLHFIKKYINSQFHIRNTTNTIWGIKLLLENNAYDYFLVKSIIKLGIKAITR